MKKFAISVVLIFLGAVSFLYAFYFKGYYIDFNSSDPIQIYAKVEGKNIFIKNKENEYKDFIIKGVNLSSSIAGNYATDYAIDYDTYLRWFKLIQEMGSNTIRTYTIYDDTFYNAFYDYNKNNENPLYLLQGIQVSDYANNSSIDAYGKGFYDELKQDSIDVVDVIHGRKIISSNNMKGSGKYTKDISPWLLGYIIGNEWNSGTIEYTNQGDYATKYTGKYFKTTSDATAFEAMLAKIMDEMINYESSKYKTQSLITFSASPEIDPFEYDSYYAKQLGKYTMVDAEHIQSTENLLSGYFVSYQLYEYCPNFSDYFSEIQKKNLTDILNNLDKSTYYYGYTQLLQEYHTMPVVISSFGYSSSRGSDQVEGPLNEKQQGERIISTYQDIIDDGCKGAFIDSWQDIWANNMWNTSYSVMQKETYRWNDVQSESTGYGLMGFRSNEIYIDGDQSDWPSKQMIINNDDIKLSSFYDEIGIYLFVEKDGLTKDQELFIPIDTTNKSGSKVYKDKNLLFERASDFLLHLQGKESRILVHSRYESLRANYFYETNREDPFINYPDKYDNNFVHINMIARNQNLINPSMNDEQIYQSKIFDVYETGKLKEGNQNPNSENTNSLADFKFGKNCVEIRIPWQLINFSNPFDLMIHDDYYENYGVEHMPVSQIYLGLGMENDSVIKMNKMELKKVDTLEYDEYLKKSYYIVKEGWRNQNEN